MQRNSARIGGHTTSSPCPVKPRPPCWLDLKAQKSSSDDGGVRLSPVGYSSVHSRSGKSTKRSRPKLHRTRSQFCIQTEDLPDCELTTSLAETKPEDLGLDKELHDDSVIMQETTRKCRNWLQSIQGCGPPDNSSCLSTPDEDDVDVEVPDDTLWYDETEIRPPYTTATSEKDCDFNVSLSNLSANVELSKMTTPKNFSVRVNVMKNPGKKYELRSSHSPQVIPPSGPGFIK